MNTWSPPQATHPAITLRDSNAGAIIAARLEPSRVRGRTLVAAP